MLPPRLLWRDPRPIPRLDPQDIVIEVVRDPSFHEPSETDPCVSFGYVCLTHDRAYFRGGCGEGEHLVALECSVHGLENIGAHPLVHRFPTGFTPALTPDQYAELENDLYSEGYTRPAGRRDGIPGRSDERITARRRADRARTPSGRGAMVCSNSRAARGCRPVPAAAPRAGADRPRGRESPAARASQVYVGAGV
ncbi:hypothetical protein OG948_01250 [Embleya sp. NBC_00888]|uniref:hypothetical protein n=1 Tax=Embleya sp. NBC_00888 TaxID=2975960 RepID=UPI00386F7E3B|nr:hypothetical protein OG948_01250 [Embleya sp. NBC_00888]